MGAPSAPRSGSTTFSNANDRAPDDGPLALRGSSNHLVRDFFLRQPFDTFRLLAAEQDRNGRTLEAIKSLDLYRLQDRFANGPSLDSEEWYREIPRDTVLISYGVFDRQLVIYAARSSGVARASVALTPSDVETLTGSFSHVIQARDDRSSRIAGHALYRALIAPVANIVAKTYAIVVVPDLSMRQIPFAALMQSSRRYLIENPWRSFRPSPRTSSRFARNGRLHERCSPSGIRCSVKV